MFFVRLLITKSNIRSENNTSTILEIVHICINKYTYFYKTLIFNKNLLNVRSILHSKGR